MTAIRLAFFDLGGVVAAFRPERRLSALASLGRVDAAALEARLWSSGLSRRFDAGELDLEAMVACLQHALGARVDRAALARAWALAFEPDAEVFAIAEALCRLVPVGLLTNNPPLLRSALASHLPAIGRVFDPVLFSYELGACKPDPEAFARAAERVELPPGALLLVDDSPENVEAARRAGWEALPYTSPAALRRELAEIGLGVS